tara:strand:- start:3841 stop:4410 length:570 start_codon:yes stop_codon:yes gene_type:complete
MPTLDELQKIAVVAGEFDPKVASAMQVIFLLTEQDNQYMADYIAVAVGLESKLSDTVRDILYPYHLVDRDGNIPAEICSAVQKAVDLKYLEVRKDGHKIRCETCGGPHQTADHYIWSSQPNDVFTGALPAELEQYSKVLEAFKKGGESAAEAALNETGLSMNHNVCFCGSSSHSGIVHLRWLADEQNKN